jgi:hypothetical protein
MPEAGGGAPYPYIGFVSNKSPNYADLITALGGVKPEGTPYIGVNGKCQTIEPFRFFLFTSFRAWVSRDQTNKLTGVSLTQPVGKSNLRDNVEAVVWAFHNGTIIPAVVSFRAAKTDPVVKGDEAIREAMTPGFAAKSPDHKLAMAIPQEFARVVITATHYADTSKKGFAYSGLRHAIAPTTVGDWRILEAALTNPTFIEQHQAALDEYMNRVKAIQEYK